MKFLQYNIYLLVNTEDSSYEIGTLIGTTIGILSVLGLGGILTYRYVHRRKRRNAVESCSGLNIRESNLRNLKKSLSEILFTFLHMILF